MARAHALFLILEVHPEKRVIAETLEAVRSIENLLGEDVSSRVTYMTRIAVAHPELGLLEEAIEMARNLNINYRRAGALQSIARVLTE